MEAAGRAANDGLMGLPARLEPRGYLNYVRGAFEHALVMMLRRQRLILAAVVTFLPVLVPLAMAFLSATQFADDGSKAFVKMVEMVHINVLGPLLALFFATMLVGEDVETQTIPYILTRPQPRSAWVLGRYLAYLAVASAILLISMALTFAACTALSSFGFNARDLKLLAHYCGVAVMGLMGYGAVTIFLGATTRRPIIIGVLVLYAWQKMATLVPGLIDFFTIQKYTDALLPILPTQRDNVEIQTVLGTFQKDVLVIGPMKAAITLVVISLVFLGCTVLAVRWREYSAARAIGA